MPELKFIPNIADEGEGLSDAGIETYRDNPFPAVARETAQNSRDAHDSVRCPDEPVRVSIDRISVPAASLPDHARYLAIVRRCLAVAETAGTKKEIAFFTQAEKALTAPKIQILRVSDSGTRGLRGPCQEGHPFHALVKSSGISDKPDDTSGGSFGIGKSAVYSASDLQTVFYSTLYLGATGETPTFLCQGKTKFRSFIDENGEPFRSIGYWGEPHGFMPVDTPDVVPEWLRRTEIGTTVCSIAVRETDDWQKEILKSLVINFFAAIHTGKMEFDVDGDIVDANTLRRRFAEAARWVPTDDEDFVFARSLYDCLTDTYEAEEHVISITGVGDFRLRILVRDGLPKRLGIIRNGLYICDNLAHFGDKFSRFPMYRDFAAILEPSGENSNTWLRAMENPRHDELSPERLLEPAQRKAAKRDGKILAKAIRDAISKAAKSAKEQDTDLEELSEFFALDNAEREHEAGSRNVDSFKVRSPVVRRKTRQTKPPPSEGPGTTGGAVEVTYSGDGHGGGGGGGDNDGRGTGTGSGKKAPKTSLPLLNPRTITVASDPYARRIFFTPSESASARLSFESAGLSDPEPLELADGPCRVACTKGVRQEITVHFMRPYDGPVEIMSWIEEAHHEAQ